MRKLVSLVLATGFVAQSTAGDVVTINPSKDNTLVEDVGQFVDHSNGAGKHVFAGRTRSGDLRRALLLFDLVGAVPPGSVINSVHLDLYCTKTNVLAGPRTFRLHRLTRDWGEAGTIGDGPGAPAQPGDATWSRAFHDPSLTCPGDTVCWQTEGGDYSAVVSSSQTVDAPDMDYSWPSTPELVADVQSWRDVPAKNFGWILVGEEGGDVSTTKRFASRQNDTDSQRPRLTIDFTPPANGPGTTLCLGAAGTCPCGNDDATAGCRNSTASGALLVAQGTASASADDLVLRAYGLPPGQLAILFTGDSDLSAAPFQIGAGLSCTGGLSYRYSMSNVDTAGLLREANLGRRAPQGYVGAGITRLYQVWVRDLGGPCGQSTNLTNAYKVTYTP